MTEPTQPPAPAPGPDPYQHLKLKRFWERGFPDELVEPKLKLLPIEQPEFLKEIQEKPRVLRFFKTAKNSPEELWPQIRFLEPQSEIIHKPLWMWFSHHTKTVKCGSNCLICEGENQGTLRVATLKTRQPALQFKAKQHKRKRWMSAQYHKRVQKKWDKRFAAGDKRMQGPYDVVQLVFDPAKLRIGDFGQGEARRARKGK